MLGVKNREGGRERGRELAKQRTTTYRKIRNVISQTRHVFKDITERTGLDLRLKTVRGSHHDPRISVSGARSGTETHRGITGSRRTSSGRINDAKV